MLIFSWFSTLIHNSYVLVLSWAKRVIYCILSPKGGLITFLGVLAIVFVAVMIIDPVKNCVGQLLGLTKKNEILTFLGIAMGGALLALQAVIANTRAKAMEKAANAQALATNEQAKANKNVEHGQRQERLKNAIGHLGNMSSSLRLGGAYELYQLAKYTPALRQTVLTMLCAHIRQITSEDEYRNKYSSIPSKEIQSLLLLLFVQEDETFKGLRPDLRGSLLNGADLSNAHLERANLDGVMLMGANLFKANFQGATILNANLRGAIAPGSNLSGATILTSNFQRALLYKSQLRGVTIIGAKMHLADLREVQLQGAVIEGAQLHIAKLGGAVLCGIRKSGVKSDGEGTSLKFEDKIRASIDKENDLSGLICEGGLSNEDMDALVAGLSNNDAKNLKNRLLPHINMPEKYGLTEGNGAVTGTYTKDDAEKWIADYKTGVENYK